LTGKPLTALTPCAIVALRGGWEEEEDVDEELPPLSNPAVLMEVLDWRCYEKSSNFDNDFDLILKKQIRTFDVRPVLFNPVCTL